MPRPSDPDHQRELIAHAVWRLASQEGTEALTLRQVAAEAGVSMGRVQHYFATKADMLLFGLELAQQRMEQRVQLRLSMLAQDAGPEDVLHAILVEMLGEHPDTRQVIRASITFQARALQDERTAAVLAAGDEELHQLAVDVVRHAQAAGQVSADLDADQEARILWSLVPSLGVDVATDRLTVEQARRTLDYHLRRLLG